MFKTVQEIQEFIVWAKSQKIKKIKLKGVEVEISELAFIDTIAPQASEYTKPQENQIDNQTKNEEEDPDLFYSAR